MKDLADNGGTAVSNRKNWRTPFLLVVGCLLFLCTLGFILIQQQIAGTIYPNAIPTAKPTYNSSSIYHHFRGEYMIGFSISQHQTWYTKDTIEDIAPYFITKGWSHLFGTTQGDETELGKPSHHFTNPTNVQTYRPLTIQRFWGIRARFDENENRTIGDANSAIYIWVTFDDPLPHPYLRNGP